ncbi:MAG: FAD/FMN-dependent dehydrogenase [Planctomycetota bacterium]|nr:FAD/FMN-dependent dehydrogenase [Planctomycetota bacterium]
MDWPESSDAPPLGDGRRAVAVDRPDSVEVLREIVRRRAAEGLAIYPQGGKTALDYGGIPRRPGVALDTTALNSVIDYPAADMTITVGSGITLAKLQEVLATEGQFLPLDAPHPDSATLGGIYATNTCGPRRFGWGRPRDMIIGVSFVTADGKGVKGGGRVVKNVAGYDFPKLLTGSMGALGIITQMTLKVRPKPEASALVIAGYSRLGDLAADLARMNTSDTRPMMMDVLSPEAGYLLEAEANRGSHGLRERMWTLVLGYEDNAASVAWQVQRASAELSAGKIETHTTGEDSLTRAILLAISSFPADRIESIDGSSDHPSQSPLSFVASVRRGSVSAFLESLQLDRWLAVAHAGSGIIHAHANPLDLPEETWTGEIQRLRDAADRLGGSLILSRCPIEWKARLKVWGDRRGDWAIMEKIKGALDPAGVMNPGRFVGTI